MKIKEADTVKIVCKIGFISKFRGETGVVERVYELSNGEGIAVVKLDMSGTLKIRLDDLVKVDQPKPAEPIKPVEPEIPEGAKKIFKTDVKAFLENLTDPAKLNFHKDGIGDLVHMITLQLIGNYVIERIFKDQDAVIMTEEELISALWDACNPVAVSETVGKKMPASRTKEISLVSFSDLSEIVDAIFDESEND